MEISYSRHRFCCRLRNILEHAFTEFSHAQIAAAINIPDNWSTRVSGILSDITVLMSSEEISFTNFKKREAVLKEAMFEAMISGQVIILDAKKNVLNFYPKLWRKIEGNYLPLDAQVEFPKMIREYLPKYNHLLERER